MILLDTKSAVAITAPWQQTITEVTVGLAEAIKDSGKQQNLSLTKIKAHCPLVLRKRQAEGIQAMPVDEEGYKVSKKTGRRFGRQSVDVDLELLDGESITEACARLGISRTTYYRKIREMGA